MPKFKKGSKEAKAYMAKIRNMKKGSKIGAVKSKPATKKAKPKTTELHKDSKSHNVNVRIVSGISNERPIITRNALESDLEKALDQYEILKRQKREEQKNKNYKMDPFNKKLLLRYPKYIASLKKQIRDQNKLILQNFK